MESVTRLGQLRGLCRSHCGEIHTAHQEFRRRTDGLRHGGQGLFQGASKGLGRTGFQDGVGDRLGDAARKEHIIDGTGDGIADHHSQYSGCQPGKAFDQHTHQAVVIAPAYLPDYNQYHSQIHQDRSNIHGHLQIQ